jgi:hypothetical protein
MKYHQFYSVLVLLSFTIASAQTVTHPAATLPAQYESAVTELVKEFGPRLERSRYMVAGEGKEVLVSGWEGFPTRRYTYLVKDKDGTSKLADAILLNPSPEKIARWIVSALVEAKGSYNPAKGKKMFQHILYQSAGQFPVAGVVYEDIHPEDGKKEIYCFRDGVTVAVEGVPDRGTAPMTPKQIAASIDGRVTRVGTYARIASTSPKMWIDAGGSSGVLKDGKPTEQWVSEIRKAYQAAWNSDRNALFVAWVKATIK